MPLHPFFAALLDALAGYVYLTGTIDFPTENVTVEDESTGSNQSLAIVPIRAVVCRERMLHYGVASASLVLGSLAHVSNGRFNHYVVSACAVVRIPPVGFSRTMIVAGGMETG